MPDIAKLQTNLNSGELDPTMHGRADTAAYQNGMKRLKNMALLNTGGATRRPGTNYKASFGSTPTRIIPFDYDENSRFLVALQAGYVKVCTVDGTVITSLVGPWILDDLRELTFNQLADTLIICHKRLTPRILKRVTDSSWTLTTYAFEASTLGDKTYQPFENFSPVGTWIQPSGSTGSITLTSNNPIFDPLHVGTRFKLEDKEVAITGFTDANTVSASVATKLEGKFIPNAFKTRQGQGIIEANLTGHGMATGDSIVIYGALGIATQSLGSGAGAAVTTFVISANDLNGTHTITVIDDDTFSFTIASTGALSDTDGGGSNAKYSLASRKCYKWFEQTFSALRGYPRAVAFHEQRLWFGGSLARPDGLWSSQIQRYFNFDVGSGNDDESIQVTIGSDLGSAVRHLVSNRHLQIFTGTKEFFCQPPVNSTLTPGTFRVAAQTSFGVGSVRPQPFDGATLFAQSTGRTIREFMYNDAEQAYNSNAVSLLSSHLINDPIDVASLRGTAQRGEQYAVFVNADGTLTTFLSARAEKLAGWVPWVTRSGDAFYSVCNIGNALYFIVLRNGNYLLEQFVADDSQLLDCAVGYSNASPQSAWTVAARFNGQTVSVVSGNFYLGDYPVVDGALDISPYAVDAITVGYTYDLEIETLPPIVDFGIKGSKAGSITRIIEALILFDTTFSVAVNGQMLINRQVRDDVNVAPAAATGWYRWNPLGYSRAPTLVLTQNEPLPLRILAIKSKVIV